MKIDSIVVGIFEENTYFLIDENTKRTTIVDPGGSGEEIAKYLEDNDLKVEMIINTHGHPDHVEANDYIAGKYAAPIYIHPEDAATFDVKYDKPLQDGEIITFAGENLKIIHTPGHTMGSLCILGDEFMLTGDTIFQGSIGRTDLGGDIDTMMETLLHRFENISGGTVLYPGHGPQTTMAQEREQNIYIKAAKENIRI